MTFADHQTGFKIENISAGMFCQGMTSVMPKPQ
jgi:hypothetical protein